MQTNTNEHDLGSVSDTKLISPLMKRWVAAFNAHDAEGIVKLYAENAELFDSGMKRPRKGRHEIRSWFVQRFREMPTIQYTPIESFFNETEGAIHWLTRGHTPPILGQRWLIHPFEVDGVSIFHMDSGLISWQHGYYDHMQVVKRVLPLLKWSPLKL